MAQNVAVLDFGSGKITVMIGKRGVNNTICVSGMGECDYAGFSHGMWHEPDQLVYAVGRAINSAQTNARTDIDTIYVGVPGEFTTVVCKDTSLSLMKKRKVTDADIDALHDLGNGFREVPDYEVINIEPIYYFFEDGQKIVQPVGMTGNKLSGKISYILAEKSFITFVDSVLSDLGITSTEYVSSVLAENLLLFDEVTRDQCVVLIDVGHSTTTVSVGRGDGLLDMYSFSQGGDHITRDLAYAFGIPLAQAESLKRKVVLSLNASDFDSYEITDRDSRSIPFPAKVVNDVVRLRLQTIADPIDKCLADCANDYPAYITCYLTGGGLSYLKGGRDYLSKCLNRQVDIAEPKVPPFSRPHMSSVIGVMDMVLSSVDSRKKKGFFARLFGK